MLLHWEGTGAVGRAWMPIFAGIERAPEGAFYLEMPLNPPHEPVRCEWVSESGEQCPLPAYRREGGRYLCPRTAETHRNPPAPIVIDDTVSP